MPPTAKRQHARTVYQKVKARAKARSAAVTLTGQDIGGLPPIADRVRRSRADRDFKPACWQAGSFARRTFRTCSRWLGRWAHF